MTIILTNCTNRKKGLAAQSLTSDCLEPGSLDIVAKQWIDRLKNAPVENLARKIYCGRSFREAEASATSLNCSLFIVSAGLGIVNSEQLIPTYNLTVSTGTPNSIYNKFSDNASANTWWSHIIKANPFGCSFLNTLEQHPDDIILIALSRPYIELLKDELLDCSIHQQNRLRFFGKKLDSVLPPSLHRNWMPYDDRLNCVEPGYSGTQTDFAQRALRHFVTNIFCDQKNGDTHRLMVLDSLSPLVSRKIIKRRRLTDQEISTTIQNNWALGKGQSTKLLRIIRHDLGIACEQSRFRDIYHTVKKLLRGAKR